MKVASGLKSKPNWPEPFCEREFVDSIRGHSTTYIAEAEGSPCSIADQTVEVSGCNVLYREAFECGDFMWIIKSTRWSSLPRQSRNTQLAFTGKILGS